MRSALLDEGADAIGRVARNHVGNHDLRGVPVGVGKADLEWIPSRCDPIGMVAEERRQLIRAIDRRKIRDGLAELKEQLEDIQRDNDQRRSVRRDQLRVALVGYTNAGSRRSCVRTRAARRWLRTSSSRRLTHATGCGFLGPREVSCKPLDTLCFCCYRPSQSKLPILLGVEVAKSEQWQCIPTRLSIEQFQQFVLPHLSIGSRGPAPKLTLHAVFNYILQSLYLGCQWKELPIEKDQEGRPEIHYTRIYGAFRRWQADGCFEAVFAGSVLKLHPCLSGLLPIR